MYLPQEESFLFRLGWCLQIIDIYFLATVWIQAVLSCTLARLTNLPIFIAFRNKFPYPDATSWVPPALAMLELYYRYTAKGKRIAFYSLVIVPSFFLCCTLLAAAQLFIEVLITKERKSFQGATTKSSQTFHIDYFELMILNHIELMNN